MASLVYRARPIARFTMTKRLWEAPEPAAIRDRTASGCIGWSVFLAHGYHAESMAPCLDVNARHGRAARLRGAASAAGRRPPIEIGVFLSGFPRSPERVRHGTWRRVERARPWS